MTPQDHIKEAERLLEQSGEMVAHLDFASLCVRRANAHLRAAELRAQLRLYGESNED